MHKILNRIDAENITYCKITYHGRDEVSKFDTAAVKEAIINAIVHNDYLSENTPIIELYSDHIEITSAGGLLPELSQEDFFKEIVARRNRELIKVFKDVNLIENIESGILRILSVYDKDSFIFMDHFLRISFKFRKNIYLEEKKDKEKTSVNSIIKHIMEFKLSK